MDTILEMRHITKTFPGVKALNDVTFSVARGEIHCLVGENGAGKSTLMKVLSGVYPHGTYTGDIVLNGDVKRFSGIEDSESEGLSIIYQELALIPELSVYENIFFGHERMRGRVIDWEQTIVEATRILKRVGFTINPATKVRYLGVGQRQLVEIAKALSRDVKLLILDEPTAALNDTDSAHLLSLLRDMKKEGITSIMITHKLNEVLSIADTITVLRDGQTVASFDARHETISEQDLIKAMVGREITNIYPSRSHEIGDDVVFAVKNWTVFDPIQNRTLLKDISFDVRRGEVVGLPGLMGAGRSELALSLFGNTPGYKIVSGEILIHGRRVSLSTPRQAIEAGLIYLTEDRKNTGLILGQDVRFNTTIANLDALRRGLTLDENLEIVEVTSLKTKIGIRTPSIEQTVGHLSGGNQQKVVLAKWLFVKPDILILDEPTRGIDVGAKYEIYQLINAMVQDGKSVIMISSELPEVLKMSDRVFVMSEGRITGELSAAEATDVRVMALATRHREETV